MTKRKTWKVVEVDLKPRQATGVKTKGSWYIVATANAQKTALMWLERSICLGKKGVLVHNGRTIGKQVQARENRLLKKKCAEWLTDSWAYKMAARLKMQKSGWQACRGPKREVRCGGLDRLGSAATGKKAKVEGTRGMAHDGIRSCYVFANGTQ